MHISTKYTVACNNPGLLSQNYRAMFLGIVDFGKSTYRSPKPSLMCEKGLGDPTPTKGHVFVCPP